MKSNMIIRGCVINDETETERELLEKRINEKVESVALETQKAMLQVMEAFTDTMKKKIDSIEEYKIELQAEYQENLNGLKKELDITKKNITAFNEQLKQDGLKKVDEYLEDSKDEIKELTLMLFEKVFHAEYKNIENLESLIKHELQVLEENKKIKVSINNDLIKNEEELKKLTDKFPNNGKIDFKLHSKEELLVEFKTEKETIEYDFKKQIDKISDIMRNFK